MREVPPPSAPDGSADAAAHVSYWAIVGAQLRKNVVAMVAWWLIEGLIVAAVAAPFFALNVPLYWHDASGSSLPLLESLFDRFLFPGGVDVFFNLLLLVGPVWLLASQTGVAWGPRRRTKRGLFWPVAASLALLEWLFVLGCAVLGRRSPYLVAFFGVALPGGAVLLLGRLLARRASTPRRLRFACVGLFTAGVLVLILAFQDTRPWKDWRTLAAHPPAGTTVTSVFPPVPFHPDNVGDTDALERARHNEPSARNSLGCDTNGRDVIARLLFGTRISLTIGLVGVFLYVLIGILLGGLAGYYGGRVDLLISRLIEVMICFPTLFLLLTIVAVFESRSIFLIMFAIGLVGWPGVARLVRGEFLRQRNLDYVTAAHAQGIPERRIIFGHVLPNCMGPVLVSATFGIAGAILIESSLAFLGLGDPTAASWGQMLTVGRTSQQWHLILAPGLAIFFVVTVFNLLGEGIRDALDPKLRK